MTVRGALRAIFLHNIGIKLLSLAIALVLWLAVANEPVAEVGLTVPVELQQVPEDLEIVGETLPVAQVRVRGPQRALRRLTPGDLHPVVNLGNLRGAGAGERTIELTPEAVAAPAYVEVVQIVPTQFRLTFDRRFSRKVVVRARVVGNPAPDHRLVGVEVEPTEVTIVGPRSRVEKVEAAMTDPIDASGVMGRMSFSAPAYVDDPLVRVAKPASVRVTVITEKIEGQAASRVP